MPRRAGTADPRRHRSPAWLWSRVSRCCDRSGRTRAEFVAELSELAPDCCPVVAFGALLRDDLLAVPAHGWVNLHFSLLPAWRGAAPVQAAIAAGDTVTGATTFQIESGLDSGPVYGVVTEAVRPIDTAGDLLDRLSISGAALLSATLDGIADGALTPVPQPADGVSVAPKITVEQAQVRWDLPAEVVERRIRAVTPNPGAWTLIGDLRVKLGPGVSRRRRAEPAKPIGARRYSRRPSQRAGWYRVAGGAARPGSGAGEEADERRRLGQGSPPRRVGACLMSPPQDKPRGSRPAGRTPQRSARPQRRKPLDPARRAALDVLQAVRERDAYPNLLLPVLLRERGISGRDAAFATELTYGSSRVRGLLDAIIGAAADRSPDTIDPVLLDLLRLGTYQLLRTRVDAHAAVSTTVEQAAIEFDSARAGFVNGVLRKISTRDEQSWLDELAPDRSVDPVGQRRVPARPPALGRTVIRRRAGRRRRRTRRGACRRR